MLFVRCNFSISPIRVSLQTAALSTSPLQSPGGSLLCAPSQNGGLAVRLQPHQATVLGYFISTSTGVMPVPSLSWAPSQNG
jgi:hypothetical protein